ncbi:hypothetical protein PC110_g8742 [Phytophthora cactorum]|uniref:Uncharacterized protein n=1 Tax=Phytophthora cactorum TaxID=29920 RepID=A0A329SDU4_9STRA|nr:hypothetical protein PC114_g21214 [Phytophthora cactorum]RAW34945.1 hypothetical protein PC110_g8742 [Phytophthora cactorum]
MTVKKLCELIEADSSGDVLYIVVDKFAIHLAVKESSKGTLLSKNSIASYFGNVKNHLLVVFPVLTRRRLQKVASILDKYCGKRNTDCCQRYGDGMYNKSTLSDTNCPWYRAS